MGEMFSGLLSLLETRWASFTESMRDSYEEHNVPGFMKRFGVSAMVLLGVSVLVTLVLAVSSTLHTGALIGWTLFVGGSSIAWIVYETTRDHDHFSFVRFANSCLIGMFVTGMTIASTGAWAGDQNEALGVDDRLLLQVVIVIGIILVLISLALTTAVSVFIGYVLKEIGEAVETGADWTLLGIERFMSPRGESAETTRARADHTADFLPDQYIFPFLKTTGKYVMFYLFPLLAFFLTTVSFKFTFIVMVIAVVGVGLLFAVQESLGVSRKEQRKRSVLLAEIIATALVVLTILEFLFGASFAQQVHGFWQGVGAIASALVGVLAHLLGIVGEAFTLHTGRVAGSIVCFGLAAAAAWSAHKYPWSKKATYPIAAMFGLVGFGALAVTVYQMSSPSVLEAYNDSAMPSKSLETLVPSFVNFSQTKKTINQNGQMVEVIEGSAPYVLIKWGQTNGYAGSFEKYRVERRLDSEKKYTVLANDLPKGFTTFKDDTATDQVIYRYRLSGFVDGRWVEGPEKENVFHAVRVMPTPPPVATPTATVTPTPAPHPEVHPSSCETNGGCSNVLQRTASLCAQLGGHCD